MSCVKETQMKPDSQSAFSNLMMQVVQNYRTQDDVELQIRFSSIHWTAHISVGNFPKQCVASERLHQAVRWCVIKVQFKPHGPWASTIPPLPSHAQRKWLLRGGCADSNFYVILEAILEAIPTPQPSHQYASYLSTSPNPNPNPNHLQLTLTPPLALVLIQIQPNCLQLTLIRIRPNCP